MLNQEVNKGFRKVKNPIRQVCVHKNVLNDTLKFKITGFTEMGGVAAFYYSYFHPYEIVNINQQKSEIIYGTSQVDVLFVRCNFSCSGLWFHLPYEIHVCCCVCVGTDANCNFSAVRSPIELKLGEDLGLVSQIRVHVLVSRYDYFLYC